MITGENELTLIYNQNLGLIIEQGEDKTYKDVDLGLGVQTKVIYIITYGGKVFISIDGLGSGNVIYTGLLPKQQPEAVYKLKFD